MMNASDPRYETLRKKLDSFKYHQTLHPTCVQLVEKILKDYLAMMSECEKERKKRKELQDSITKSNLTQNHHDQIDFLNQKNHQLEKQLQILKNKQQDNGVDLKIEKLTSTLHQYKIKYDQKVKDFNDQIRSLSDQVEQLTFRNKELSNQNSQIKNINTSKTNQFDKYNSQLTFLIEKKNKEIKELEENNSKMRLKVSILQKSIDDLKENNQQIKNESTSENSKIIQMLKSQLSEGDKKYELCKLQLQDNLKENEIMRSQLRKLNEQLNSYKVDDNRNRSIENINKHSKQKIQSLYEEAMRNLNQKIEENNQIKDQKLEDQSLIEKLHAKIKDITNKNKTLSDNIAQLNQDISTISNKYTIQMKKLRELEGINIIYEKQLKELQEKLKQSCYSSEDDEKDNKKAIRMEQKYLKQSVTYEREIKLLNEDMKSYKEDSHKVLLQNDKLKVEVKKLLNIITEGNKNLEIIQLQKEELMKENKDIRSIKDTVASSDYTNKHQLLRFKDQLQEYQQLIQDLKATIKNQQHLNKELSNQNAKLNTALNKNQERNKEIFEDNKMMVNQIKMLEVRKGQLFQKLKIQQEEKEVNQSGKLEYKKQYDQLYSKYEQLINQLKNKENHLHTIDYQRDQLQNLVDQKTEENQKLKQSMKSLEKESHLYNRGMNEKDINLQGLQKKLEHSESERSQIQRDFNTLYEDCSSLKISCSKYEVKIRQLENQISLLVLSNSDHQKEVDRSRNRVVDLDKKIKESHKQYDQEREKATTLNILNHQLTQELQKERLENQRDKSYIAEFQKENNKMYYCLMEKDKELEEIRFILDESEKKEGQLLHEIKSYEREIVRLGDDLQRKDEDIHRLCLERDAYRAENNWKRQNTHLSQDRRVMLEEQNFQMQQEYEMKRREVEQLRIKVRELESIINEERTKNFNLEKRIQNVRNGNNTPIRSVLIESRVESHQQSENNLNRSNLNTRSISENYSIEEQPQNQSYTSEVSSVRTKEFREKMEMLERQYVNLGTDRQGHPF